MACQIPGPGLCTRPHSVLVLSLCVLAWASPAWGLALSRPPYLQLQEPDSIHILWMTDAPCTAEVDWGPTTSYGQVALSPSPVTRHEVALIGLTPDTNYHYRIRLEGSGGAAGTFRTAPAAGSQSASFAFVGDSCSAPSNAAATYNAMLQHCPNGFCITLGDLAGRGEDNLTDYWKIHFFDPAGEFLNRICMYPTIGNHELYDEDSFPNFVPPTKYLANWSLPTAGSGTEQHYSITKGPVHLASLDTWGSSFAPGSAQHNWLAADLAASTSPWKIVYAHTGPYISQLGGTDGSTTVRSQLVPLLRQHGVDLYLHGHYHDYQRNDIDGVTYIVQGTGGQPLTERADDLQPYVQAYAGGTYCFTRLDVQGNRIIGKCLRTSDRVVIDGWQLDKPRIGLPLQDHFPPGGSDLNWIAPWNFTTQCGPVTKLGNPSRDGSIFAVADSSGHQFAYPMLTGESLTDYSIEAQVYWDSSSPVQTRYGLGLRGRQLFDPAKRSYYAFYLACDEPNEISGLCRLVRYQGGTETVLCSWLDPIPPGWRRLKLSAEGGELRAWMDGRPMSSAPVCDVELPKGRPFIYNFRAAATGSKTFVDDVLIAEPPQASLISDFESGTEGAQMMFRVPSFSGSTAAFVADLQEPLDSAQVATVAADCGTTKACQVKWAFVDAGRRCWLRLTTSNAAGVPNPAVSLDHPIAFKYRLTSPASLRMCIGIRETGVDVPIGADGGKSGAIEWLGAGSVVEGAPQGRLIEFNPEMQWQTIIFDPQNDPVRAFTGDGVLEAPNRKGVLEHVAVSVVDAPGPFTLELDEFEQPIDGRPAYAGDFDGDADVDQDDFAFLQRCMDRQLDPACAAADLAGGGRIDEADVARFGGCMSGPGQPAPADCLLP